MYYNKGSYIIQESKFIRGRPLLYNGCEVKSLNFVYKWIIVRVGSNLTFSY